MCQQTIATVQRLHIYLTKKKRIINLTLWTAWLFSDTGADSHILTRPHSHTLSRHHMLVESHLGMKRSILFSASTLVFSHGACAWTICCQVCVNISTGSTVLMARLWIVATAMAKCGQTGDVHQGLLPRETASVCACILRCVQSPPPSLPTASWEVSRSMSRATARSCFLFFTTEGFGTTQHPVFAESHQHSLI